MQQKGNPNEKLTFNTPLEPSDAIAELGEMMGLDDAGVIAKIPWLKRLEKNKKVIFVDDGGGDTMILDEESDGYDYMTNLVNKGDEFEVTNHMRDEDIYPQDDPIYPPDKNGWPDVPMHD